MGKVQNMLSAPLRDGSIEKLKELMPGARDDEMDFFEHLWELKKKDLMMSDEERTSPDTFGCKSIFLEYFVTRDMEYDFAFIARDFLLHEYMNIKDHEMVMYLSTDSREVIPFVMFENCILNLMMNAVDAGSEYTKNLFLYLYKTYYKREYRQLKRFNKMVAGDVFTLAGENENGVSLGNIARILEISAMSGMEIDPDCNFVYLLLNEHLGELDPPDESRYLDAVNEKFTGTDMELLEIFGSEDEMERMYRRMEPLMSNIVRAMGYRSDYVYLSDFKRDEIMIRLRNTLAVMKMTFKDKEFSKEEIITYGCIAQVTDSLCCVADSLERRLDAVIYGERIKDAYSDKVSLFNPDEVAKGAFPFANTKPIKESEDKTEETLKYKEEALLKEIEILRRKIHIQETDIKQLKAENAGRKKLMDENLRLKEELDSEHKEVVALRNHLYQMTEEGAETESELTIDDMKKYLSSLRIIIIGGHSNWRSKMKQEFPNWTYVDADVSGSIDGVIVKNADRVYFFTDTISHSTYYRYMNIVREHGVDFGYIHGVNIDKNVQSMYSELMK